MTGNREKVRCECVVVKKRNKGKREECVVVKFLELFFIRKFVMSKII